MGANEHLRHEVLVGLDGPAEEEWSSCKFQNLCFEGEGNLVSKHSSNSEHSSWGQVHVDCWIPMDSFQTPIPCPTHRGIVRNSPLRTSQTATKQTNNTVSKINEYAKWKSTWNEEFAKRKSTWNGGVRKLRFLRGSWIASSDTRRWLVVEQTRFR